MKINKLKTIVVMLCLWLFLYNVTAQPRSQGVWEMQWSPNGEQLAIADLNGNVYILNLSNNSTEVLTEHTAQVYTVSWSPDGQSLASGGLRDRFIYIWNISSGALHQRVYPFDYDNGIILDPGVSQIVWSPDGAYLLATSFDTFQFWETASWTPLEPSRSGSLMDAEWSPDGSLLAVTDIYYLSFFDGQTLVRTDLDNDVIEIVGENPEQLSWSSNSQLLATTDRLDPRISIWDVPTRTRIGVLNTSGPIFKDVVFISEDEVAALTETGAIYILGISGNVIATYETGVNEARTLAWNESSGIFAVGGAETVIDENGISELPLITLDDVLPSPIVCDITLPATDTIALISAITSANSAGTPQTICLETGTYSLTAVDHSADGPNGLPSISGDITLVGLGSGATIERSSGAPDFRLLNVTTSGSLTLENVSIRNTP